ncbi:hypothetical protein HM1_1990 [Heliomicrobium modesticaldum Ice1]|uniref:Uncharacterized protein n=1 Tax=Heliobacterium modesticaldum (strain ATCC 51547 / Ice1) TaxID=498761 RepID=B0TG53_HELMI|nr:hypothetical protein HM1_1990 [Heliomicrobium modesticaldum Ice1]
MSHLEWHLKCHTRMSHLITNTTSPPRFPPGGNKEKSRAFVPGFIFR